MPDTQTSLSVWDILKLALSTGVATALLNNFFGEWRDRRKELTTTTRDATYLAIRVAVILERFAMACANIIADNHMYNKAGGHAGAAHAELPPIAEYPTDADWKAIDPTLSARALSLPNELCLSEGAIKFSWEIEPTDEGVHLTTCNGEAGKCGYRAWQLAADMRHRYGLPEVKPEETAWNS
jgi:hypothetical protein